MRHTTLSTYKHRHLLVHVAQTQLWWSALSTAGPLRWTWLLYNFCLMMLQRCSTVSHFLLYFYVRCCQTNRQEFVIPLRNSKVALLSCKATGKWTPVCSQLPHIQPPAWLRSTSFNFIHSFTLNLSCHSRAEHNRPIKQLHIPLCNTLQANLCQTILSQPITITPIR